MTEREQIEQRIAENERKIAEGERKMIEQERNMAKQIKDLLDQGVPTTDMAKATEFSLEYIETLLEKYYPQVSAKEQNSDIQSQLNFLKQQVQILQNKLENQEFENVQLKQQLNTIQTKGANMAENNEPIQVEQITQQWEYMSKDFAASDLISELNKLGEQGWEVVDGIRANCGRETVFKRIKPKTPKTQKKDNGYGYGR